MLRAVFSISTDKSELSLQNIVDFLHLARGDPSIALLHLGVVTQGLLCSLDPPFDRGELQADHFIRLVHKVALIGAQVSFEFKDIRLCLLGLLTN